MSEPTKDKLPQLPVIDVNVPTLDPSGEGMRAEMSALWTDIVIALSFIGVFGLLKLLDIYEEYLFSHPELLALYSQLYSYLGLSESDLASRFREADYSLTVLAVVIGCVFLYRLRDTD